MRRDHEVIKHLRLPFTKLFSLLPKQFIYNYMELFIETFLVYGIILLAASATAAASSRRAPYVRSRACSWEQFPIARAKLSADTHYY